MNNNLFYFFPIYFVLILVHYMILYFIYTYINDIYRKCDCKIVTAAKTGFFNFYVYSIIGLDLFFLYLFYFNPRFLIKCPNIYLLFIRFFKVYNVIVYLLLFKYIYDISKLCDCVTIDRNIGYFLKYYLGALFLINLVR